MLDSRLAKMGSFLGRNHGTRKHKTWVYEKFKLFGNFWYQKCDCCVYVWHIKKLGLDPRKRTGACQLMWGQAFLLKHYLQNHFVKNKFNK